MNSALLDPDIAQLWVHASLLTLFEDALLALEPLVQLRSIACLVFCDMQGSTHRFSYLIISKSIHTEWQWPIYGIQFIMMEKSALAGEGGDGECTAIPFHSIYHHVQSCSVHSS
jgi:hypothetical protein